MARAQETYGKKEREKKRLKKREEKAKKKAERQANAVQGLSFEDQLVYVDENGVDLAQMIQKFFDQSHSHEP